MIPYHFKNLPNGRESLHIPTFQWKFQWKLSSSGKIKENEVKTANREKIQQIQASTMRNRKDFNKNFDFVVNSVLN